MQFLRILIFGATSKSNLRGVRLHLAVVGSAALELAPYPPVGLANSTKSWYLECSTLTLILNIFTSMFSLTAILF